ncbi:hypothetical protein LTR37_000622 [Vermiconidia calcicola]|uniref:Uncharacterized protein n=1 Tax=Vermiconidia calcicola TaxID=1690605 RepID=A0ACC3P0K1_9PEZI|nr:hypothetical protein LTR37_000622 [Vermiconidia calcicola]
MATRATEHYVAQRLSLKGQLCTLRYIGPVADKPGEWLGVEWDDPARGKHNGTYDGTVYFTCRSTSRTCASFLRPTQQWDPPRTFLQAVREKYMPEFHDSEADLVYFSGKQAEEIGFEKFHRRQAKLQGIHVLVLDRMCIQHQPPGSEDGDDAIATLCASITELDLSANLFETFDEVVDLCSRLPKLLVLTLDGNRFSVDTERKYPPLPAVQSLSLSETLLSAEEVNSLISHSFPSLRSLTLAKNEYSGLLRLPLSTSVSTLDLSDNNFASLSDLKGFHVDNPSLHTLLLKRNSISIVNAHQKADFCLPIRELDLSYNAIDSFAFFNEITPRTLPALKHLRVTGNPLYKDIVSADGKALTAEDGYMLTIARLPQLESLNYSKITEKERLNAETYYLGQIAIELANVPEDNVGDVLKKHPRYRDLCEEYGEPTIQRQLKKAAFDPNSLAARLVTLTFTLSPALSHNHSEHCWIEELPKSLPIYALLGLVGKRLGIMPLDLRLVLETNERDPVGLNAGYAGPEWWDSSDDEVEGNGEGEWVRREVEMVAGTRALGTFVEGMEASVRVETKR